MGVGVDEAAGAIIEDDANNVPDAFIGSEVLTL